MDDRYDISVNHVHVSIWSWGGGRGGFKVASPGFCRHCFLSCVRTIDTELIQTRVLVIAIIGQDSQRHAIERKRGRDNGCRCIEGLDTYIYIYTLETTHRSRYFWQHTISIGQHAIYIYIYIYGYIERNTDKPVSRNSSMKMIAKATRWYCFRIWTCPNTHWIVQSLFLSPHR